MPDQGAAAAAIRLQACAGGSTVLDLWSTADNTNRQLYRIDSPTGVGSIIGLNVSLVNVGPSSCTSFVGIGSTTQCATTTVGVYADTAAMASAAGTRSWVLENAAGIDRVYIAQRGRGGGCPVRYLGATNDCGVTGTGLFAKDDPSAQTVWHLIRV